MHTARVDFIYLKLPADAALAERLDALHASLDEALQAAGLGAVIGWGRSLGGPPPGPSSWHRIDIESPATEQALPLLRLSLAGLAAPAGSELHYSQAGQALQDDWSGQAWAPPRPSTGHGLGRRRAR